MQAFQGLVDGWPTGRVSVVVVGTKGVGGQRWAWQRRAGVLMQILWDPRDSAMRDGRRFTCNTKTIWAERTSVGVQRVAQRSGPV